MNTRTLLTAVTLVAAGTTVASAVNFKEIGRLDVTALQDASGRPIAQPLSVGFSGGILYVGEFGAGGQVVRIDDPLGSATVANVFGTPAIHARGVDSLDANFEYVASVSGFDINAATDDLLEVHTIGGVQTLSVITDAPLATPANYGADGRGFSGVALDPGFNGQGPAAVSSVVFAQRQRIANDVNGGALLSGDPGTAEYRNEVATTGGVDVAYNDQTGDHYLLTIEGISKMTRDGAQSFVQYPNPPFPTQGWYTQASLGLTYFGNADFNQDQNLEFVNAAKSGGGLPTDLLLVNNPRNAATASPALVDIVEAFDANAPLGSGDNPASDSANDVAINWMAPDGSPFVQAAQTFVDFGVNPFDAIVYDFAYDIETRVLAVSDLGSGHVYFFAVPEPASAALLGLGGLAALRRRQA
ncbi:PEP-CTERM sorting domain-containing protein [Mucisphaera sp.]|uniref:PEP-CTERM sorting domain-containing protein n=1 Tax=Mucisphaera sp. TaxID=2913024 RepID=UPI003D0A8A7A